MGELYNTTRNNITMHIQNIFAVGELEEKAISKKFLLTASDGKNYKTNYYNNEEIIFVTHNKVEVKLQGAKTNEIEIRGFKTKI